MVSLIPHIASGCSLRPPHSWSSATCKSTINIPLSLPQPCCLLEEDGNQICSRTRWRGSAQRGGPAPRRELARSPPEAHTRAQRAEAAHVGLHLQTRGHPPKCVRTVTPLRSWPADAQRARGNLTHKAHTCFLGRGRQSHSASELVKWNLRDHLIQSPHFTGKNLRPWLNLDCDPSLPD